MNFLRKIKMFGFVLGVCLLFSFCSLQRPALKPDNKYAVNGNLLQGQKRVWVFVLAGQSNMAGRGSIEGIDTLSSGRILSIDENGKLIPAKEPLHFYEPKMKGTGCGLAFGKELLQYIPKDVTILLIPTAVGGSSIDQWLNNSKHRDVELLANFAKQVELGKKYGEVKAILWHQGESDANPEGIRVRQEKLRLLASEFRAIVKNESLPILMGELGSYSKNKQYWAQMNEQMRLYSSTDINTSIISTADFADKGDSLHFDSASQREMGRRFAKEYINKFGSR